MNLKNEKGITTIDVTVSIILITLFVALIAVLIYNVNKNSDSMERRADATNYVINAIEEVKITNFDNLQNSEQNIGDTGYYEKITVIDYADLKREEQSEQDDSIISGLVKKVTVEVSYKDGDTTQTVDLSTIRTKYD